MRSGRKRRRGQRQATASPPIPVAPVDLLAGLAPGVELFADDLPPGIIEGSEADGPMPATTTVAEVGKLLRAGDATVRRLIHKGDILPGDTTPPVLEPRRAGVVPRTPDKPGE